MDRGPAVRRGGVAPVCEEMTRSQWLVVAFIGVVAVVAYNRATDVAQYLGVSFPPQKSPSLTA